jgi:hypothetical protein
MVVATVVVTAFVWGEAATLAGIVGAGCLLGRIASEAMCLRLRFRVRNYTDGTLMAFQKSCHV